LKKSLRAPVPKKQGKMKVKRLMCHSKPSCVILGSDEIKQVTFLHVKGEEHFSFICLSKVQK
jgi:hypothetical protein